jgi:hypothetical protein
MDPELLPLIGLAIIGVFVAGLAAAIVRDFTKEED